MNPAEREARALFADAFGGAPDGVWAAPGRVNLIGEHLDYNGGPVLPFALEQATFAAVRVRDDGELHLVSAAGDDALHGASSRWSGRVDEIGPADGPHRVDGWAAYPAGVVWALRQGAEGRAGHDVPGLDVAITSTVPLGAGLSSSAALECAVALAVADLAGLPTDDTGRAALALACVRAENEVAGASTGGMDQAVSLRATAEHALLLETVDASVEQVPLDLAAAGLAVLVVDTRAPHQLADGQYAARRASCERAAAQLGVEFLAELTDAGAAVARLDGDDPADTEVLRRRVRHVVTETARTRAAVALLATGSADDLRALGPLLDASHDSLRDDYEVSCPELDVVVEAARAAGALGARMTGGGFGGSAIALVGADELDRVRAAVLAAAARADHPEPAFLVARPHRGAWRADGP